MKIVVYFIGLMLHIGSDKDPDGHYKSHVAIVDAPNHQQAIVLWKNGVAYGSPIPINPGDRIGFKHGIGVVSTDPTFRETVPHLRTHTRTPANGQTDLHAKPASAGFPHSHVAAYFWYPPSSSMTASHHSSCLAQFILDDPDPDPVRVAVINMITAPRPSGKVFLQIVNGTNINDVEIPPDVDVIVANITKTPGQHFAHYKGLTTAWPNGRIAHVKRPQHQKCTRVPPTGPLQTPAALHKIWMEPFPECGNSQWP